jgi:hypothetical protein
MKVTLNASTGAKLVVWRQEDVFHASRTDVIGPPQICLPVDLFEVIAELAGLDLDSDGQSAEAMQLAAQAQQRLTSASERRGRSG